MDFDFISAVIGAVGGFSIAVVMGQAKFARIQNEARELFDKLVQAENRLIREQRLTEGLALELSDAATAKATTKAARTAKK
jgi:DNA-binding ferritin-like protein